MESGKVDIDAVPLNNMAEKAETAYDQRESTEEYLDLARLVSNYPGRKEGETQLEYQDRLHTYCIGLIGIIEACEEQANMARMREARLLSKRLSQSEDDEAIKETIELIRKHQKKVKQYEKMIPDIAEKYLVWKRGKSLMNCLE